MPEEKRKINCLIPASMYEKIEASDYKNITEAVNDALEHLMNDNSDDMKCYTDEIEGYKHSIEEYHHEIEGYKRSMEEAQRQIRDLENSAKEKSTEILRLQKVIQELPDRSDLAELKGLNEGRLQVIEEKDKRIEALEREVSRLDMFTHYFKNVEIKQLEAPAAEKKRPWYKFW